MQPNPCFAEWTKTIDCPAGRVYRDVRGDGGRNEFCELLLPGSLKVRDGPSRWWYSEGHFGGEGSYKNGRKIGKWKECDSFDRCHDQTYELVYPQEKEHGVKPGEIPLTYLRGKYVFDFGSCWSTWVRRQTAESFLELNIYGGLIRCQITYIPSTEKDRSTGSDGNYLCEVPYSVGIRELESLDLSKELPKAGLPQFCRQPEPRIMQNGNPAQAFAIWVNQRFLDGRTNKEARGWTTLANVVDVECAAITKQGSVADMLAVRLNEYAEKLVLDRVGKDEIKADACGGRFPLLPLETIRDGSGRTVFTYRMSENPATAGRQRACITAQTRLQSTCSAR
jgi:hypothetical protein